MDFTRIEKCLCCLNEDLVEVLDLKKQPPANSFYKNGEKPPEKYELKLMGCQKCGHTQLSIALNPDILFRNYPYVSGTSQTLNNYFQFIAEIFTKGPFKGPPGRVLDIASNDGTFLDKFQTLGWETYGVDPAENLFEATAAKGHIIICDYWNDKVANELPHMDIITAVNVFAHTQHIDAFLQSCKKVMHDRTRLIIQTSQANMLQNGEFDTIYHEHINFFSVNSMYTLARRNGLYLNHLSKPSIHGTSFVFELGLIKKEDKSVINALVQENLEDKKELFESYAYAVHNQIDTFRRSVAALQEQGKTVVGYSAPAKGMTLLNASDVHLEYLVDDNELKMWKIAPGVDTPVSGPVRLLKDDRDLHIIILAWNFYDEIAKKIQLMRPHNKDVILSPFELSQV